MPSVIKPIRCNGHFIEFGLGSMDSAARSARRRAALHVFGEVQGCAFAGGACHDDGVGTFALEFDQPRQAVVVYLACRSL
tara:strand:+ start:44224 stop:44463 length:240 start_codon:yes stop_codon:yes gene_type:complete